jgi:hypothetical protein
MFDFLSTFLPGRNVRLQNSDSLEREADRTADRVLASPPHSAADGLAIHDQRSADHVSDQAATAAPPSVDRALSESGSPLDSTLRQDMEKRFGHDFSRVRVHSGAAAEQSARDLDANAYTMGHDVVFGEGRFSPGTATGRRLLAHELTHVVQQRGGPTSVQRDPKKDAPPPATKTPAPAAKTDVSIVLSESEADLAEGSAYAKTVLRVTDVADAAAKLKALGAPIGKLFVVSHSNAAGQVQFISSIGTISWVPIGDLAKALKGAAAIDEVDFRGCKVGDAPAAMESFRQTVGAQSTKGSNCWTFIQRATPLTIDGADVVSQSQIPKGQEKAFDQALLQQLANMKAANKVGVQDCLVGLAAGERANAANLAKVWKLYWANKGNLIASWGSPDYNEDWQKDSICSKDMTASTKPCATVETKAPAPAKGGGGGQTGQVQQVRGAEVNSGER